jgi:hypothetical protein
LTEITNGVTVTVATSVAIDQTTVDAGGNVAVAGGVTLTVADAPGTDLDVFGTVTNSGTITPATGAAINFESGSGYYHAENGGAIPACTWNQTSTCTVLGVVGTIPTATTFNQNFGNVVWNCPSQTAELSLAGDLKNVSGNLTIRSTGSSQLDLAKSGFSTAQMNIAGDLNVQGGTVYIYSSSATGGTVTLAVGGNVAVTGGVLAGGTNVASFSDLVFTNNSGTRTFTSGGSFSGPIHWEVLPGITVNLGTSVVGGTGTFTVDSGGGLITARANGFSGNFTLASTNVSLSTGGNYTYDGVSLQSGDSLLPATVAGLTVSNNLGLVLHQATTATNMALIASPVTGNLSVPNTGAMVVSGGGCSVTGNLSLNAGSLTLVSSNNFPQLTIISGTASLNGGNIALTVLGAPIAEGTYLLVDTASGGTVSGALPALVNLSGTALPSWSTGLPQITGGKLYVTYQKFFSAVDAGPGFFSGENLQHEDVSGRTFYVWSTSDLTQPVSNWTLEGPTVEFPISGSSPAMSQYGITVTPSASPMYYVVATTNVGPFLATEPLITLTTSDYVSFDVGATNTLITSGGVFELVPPVITPVTITPGSAHLSSGAMTFAFTNATGLTFTIVATNNLAAPVATWPAIGTATESPAGSGSYHFSDPSAASNPQRFYLLRQP